MINELTSTVYVYGGCPKCKCNWELKEEDSLCDCGEGYEDNDDKGYNCPNIYIEIKPCLGLVLSFNILYYSGLLCKVVIGNLWRHQRYDYW